MKHYRIEPTMKKSVIEWTTFKRIDEEGNTIFLRKELGWRWGSWMISVPETEEEALEYIKGQGYENALDWAYDHGHTITDDNGDEILDPDTTLAEMIESRIVPSEDEDFVDITEDYPDAEMIECWDGCWEYWSTMSHQTEIDEELSEAWCEEAEAAYEEDYEAGVCELGWEEVGCYFELHCSPSITPCDEEGVPLEDAA